MAALLEARHPGEFILSEADGHLSRENVPIGVSQTILAGTVLGAAPIVASETSSIVVGTNTGNGVATLANPATSQAAVDGDYLLTCTAAAANAGTFSVQTPDGREIGPLTVGVAFNKEIKLTIADGATDFAVGDSFKVRVGIENPGDMTFGALNLTGTDGSQNAAGIAIYPAVTDGSTTVKIAAMVRLAEVNAKCIEWPVGITAAQKAEAIVQLARNGIRFRDVG
jgi:hypothetical protein